MKEVTYEDWQKNPTPRMMWCWDDETYKVKRMVVYIAAVNLYPTISVNEDGAVTCYKHCAEIEEPKTRRMTNQELSRWLREGSRRESRCTINSCVYSAHFYEESKASEEVDSRILIREDNGEWREPLVEVEE